MATTSGKQVIPELPSGFTLDGDEPSLPEGFRLDRKKDEGGFTAAAKTITGMTLKGAGQLASDLYLAQPDNALAQKGQQLIEANPTAIHSLEDISDKPWTAVKEGTGMAAAPMAGIIAARALGQGITAAAPLAGPAAPLVAATGQAISWLGPPAITALPSLSGIRDKQIFNDPDAQDSWRDKAVALLGAATVGAIETRFGPQNWVLAAFTREGRAELAKKFTATTFPGRVGQGVAKGAAIEGAEELVQNPIEQLAAYDDPTTPENVQDTLFGGAMGAIGGGVIGGGVSLATGNRPQASLPQQERVETRAEIPAAPLAGPENPITRAAQAGGIQVPGMEVTDLGAIEEITLQSPPGRFDAEIADLEKSLDRPPSAAGLRVTEERPVSVSVEGGVSKKREAYLDSLVPQIESVTLEGGVSPAREAEAGKRPELRALPPPPRPLDTALDRLRAHAGIGPITRAATKRPPDYLPPATATTPPSQTDEKPPIPAVATPVTDAFPEGQDRRTDIDRRREIAESAGNRLVTLPNGQTVEINGTGENMYWRRPDKKGTSRMDLVPPAIRKQIEAVEGHAPAIQPDTSQLEDSKAKLAAEFKAKAERIGASKGLLRMRLTKAKNLLADEYRNAFGKGTFDPEGKRMVSDDGTRVLQWTNDGATSEGTITFENVSTAAKPAEDKQAPQPNKHSVYDEDTAETIKYTSKKATASIRVLQIGDKWISADDINHKQGNYTGHSSPLTSHTTYPSREAAIAAAAQNIIRQNEDILLRRDSLITKKQRDEARAIVAWAKKQIGATESAKQDGTVASVEPGKATEQPPIQKGTEPPPGTPQANQRWRVGGVGPFGDRIGVALGYTTDKKVRIRFDDDGTTHDFVPHTLFPVISATDEAKAKKPSRAAAAKRRSLERAAYNHALTASEILEDAGSDLDTFTKNADQVVYAELERQKREAEASGDAELAEAIGGMLKDGKTTLPDDFYRSLHKAVRKAAKQAALENARDPETYKAALSKAAAERSIAEEAMPQFQQGWDHAIKGKTKSTLPSGEVLDAGYKAAQTWLKTPEGRGYFDGKRGKKLEGTGTALRRWFDKAKKQVGDAGSADLAAAWAAIESATTRADLFREAVNPEATPGLKALIESLRDTILPFKEWLNGRNGPLDTLYGSYSKVDSVRVQYFLDGKAYLDGKKDATPNERLTVLKDAAESYLDELKPVLDIAQEAKTVSDFATAFDKLFIADASKSYWQDSRLTENGKRLNKLFRHARSYRFEKKNLLPNSMYADHENDAAYFSSNTTRKRPLTPPRLDRVTRQMQKDHRKGKNITPKQFKDTFGFKDVGFGKWVGAKQDQDHLNYAYDAFMDMADLLGIKPKDISLGGTLYFTIGALGHGKFAAHYSPNQPHPDGGTVPVINVTNTRGDGTLAHEWHHALDFHLRGTKDNNGTRAVREIMSELRASYNYDKVRDSAIRMLRGDSWFSNMKRDGDGVVGNALYAVSYYSKRQVSDYGMNADKLDRGSGKPYWGTDDELWARAGESFVSDALDGVNDYLVNPEWVSDGKVKPPNYRGTPYPEGEERKRFNEHYQAFFKSLEWHDNGPYLNPHKWAENRPGYAAEYRKAIDDLRAEIPEIYAQLKNEARAKELAADEEQVRKQREADELAAREAAAKKAVEQSDESPAGELSDDEISSIFDEALAVVQESTQEQPKAKPAGDDVLDLREKNTKPNFTKKTDTDKTAKVLISEAAKLGVKGIDEAMHGLAELFGGPGKLSSFPGSFDEETYKKAKPHFEASLKAFQEAGRTLKEFFVMLIKQFGDGVRPYAERFAKDMSLTANLGTKPSASRSIAKWVTGKLSAGETIRWQDLFDAADKAYGGTQADGAYTPKDAYDAMEAGVNLFIKAGNIRPTDSIDGAERDIKNLSRILDNLPTQTKRTGETDEFQQFSTPPPLAYAATWVANIRAGETMLEPSAGIGGIAIFSDMAGAQVIVNELSARRAAVLREVLPNATHYAENAEQLNNVLPDNITPSVIVMNPPFSATAGRLQGERKTAVGALHIEQALKRLEKNGRLVAIVGEGMGSDKPAFKEWWAKIKAEYTVRANIPMSGKGYAKYGTTFDNQLLVIDKTGPTTGEILTTSIDSPVELPKLLAGVRHARVTPTDHAGQPTSAQPGSERIPAEEMERPDDRTARTESDAVGAGERTGGKEPATTAEPGGSGEPDRPAGEGKPPPRNALPGGSRKDRGQRAGRGGPAEDESATRRGDAATGVARGQHGGDGGGVTLEQAERQKSEGELSESVFEAYAPQRLKIAGAKPHPGKLVQSAALAAVEPPAPTYIPNLPKDVIDKGLLSLAQLEAVVYAGQAHQQFLPSGERRGFFIGDGTGVGKGREIAGIILDNLRQGRKKAVWMSASRGLIRDAKRDFSGIGGNAGIIFDHGKTKASGSIKLKDGILFTTYSTLRGGEKKQATDKQDQGKSRVKQLVDWLGADFDGVIIFDEAHRMGNAIQTKGARGNKKPSQQAMAGVELQKLLPKARVVYVSATAATEVENLVYAQRLGLWGENTAFSSATTFVNEIKTGGVAAMELVAHNLKSLGSYISRSLSYEGVTYERLEHELSSLQTDIYNELAKAWQVVLNNVEEALKETLQGKDGKAKSAAMSRFWGTNQRFFKYVITSLQMPTVIDRIQNEIKKGNAVVLQLVDTNEAEQDRQAARAAEEGVELEELDFTPRQALLDYVRSGFPVQQYEERTDEEGKKFYVPSVNSAGQPIINKEMVAKREEMLKTLETIKVPDNPLDIILETFGTETVAEVTGRSRRFVRARGVDNEIKTVEEKRGASSSATDADDFMQDKKRILVFSDAGGTGYSFHSDNTQPNKRQRVHILIQPGWRADNALQGFGRTHRTNQANEPIYILPSTNLKAQKRFISSIARRLDQLGALTRGQRQAGGQGIFSASDNLESHYAKEAIQVFFEEMYAGHTPLDFNETTRAMGLNNLIDPKTGALSESKIPSVQQFLNRLLSLEMKGQDVVFDEFYGRLEDIIRNAIEKGTYDHGVETVRAISAKKMRDEVAYTDPRTGAETRYVELELEQPTEFTDWQTVTQRAELAKSDFAGYFRNNRTGKVFALINRGTRTTAEGKTIHRAVEIPVSGKPRYIDNATDITDPNRRNRMVKVGEIQRPHYVELTSFEAEEAWAKEREQTPKTHTQEMHLITGAILPIWDRVTGNPRVVRTQTTDGERLLGRVVSKADLKQTLKNLGIGSSVSKLTPGQILKKIQEGERALLANGWEIRTSRVSNEDRIEIVAASIRPSDIKLLEEQGAFVERIQWKDRVFIPVGEQAESIFSRIIASKPVVDMIDPKEGATKFSRNEPRFGGVSASGLATRDAEATVARITAGYKNLPAIHLHETADQAPAELHEQIERGGAANDVEGAFHEGKIHLFINNIRDEARLEHVLIEHEITHYGLRGVFGAKLDPILNYIFLTNQTVRAQAARLKTQLGLKSNVEATEEVLAEMRNAELAKLKGWDRLIMFIRNWLADHGFTAMADRITKHLQDKHGQQGEADLFVADVVRKAREWARTGKQSKGTQLYMGVTRLSDVPEWYYSALAVGIESAKQQSMPAAQWKAWLAANRAKLGIKLDEVDAVGLNEWLDLQQGKVTKDTILDFVRQNGVQVEDVEIGGGDALRDRIARRQFGRPYDALDDDGRGYVDDRITEEGERQTKFASYQLPGGERYRELLLTLPANEYSGWMDDAAVVEAKRKLDTAQAILAEAHGDNAINSISSSVRRSPLYKNYVEAHDEYIKAINKAEHKKQFEAGVFQSQHFTEPNILAHVRFNERTDSEGKRVLFLEEVQSDWAQKGRKEGFAETHAADDAALAERRRIAIDAREKYVALREQIHTTDGLTWRYDPAVPYTKALIATGTTDRVWRSAKTGSEGNRLMETAEWKAADNAYNESQRLGDERSFRQPTRIPSAPFVTDTKAWAMLAMKRMIRYAAENGFDRIAWTTGEQQAARYDLSSQISELNYLIKSDNGPVDLSARTNDGRLRDIASDVPLDKVDDYVGKEVGQKIRNFEGTPKGSGAWRTLSGLDLKVGGEGMKAFYDQMLPQWVNKYVKKWGAKVRQTTIDTGERGGEWAIIDATDEGGQQVLARFETMEAAHRAIKDYDGGVDVKNMPVDSVAVHSIDITPAMRESVMQGQPLFSLAQTATAAFKKWFRNSVVTENGKPGGKPLVVYHGTNQNIQSFLSERAGANTKSASSKGGFFFTQDAAEASDYAKMSSRRQVSNAIEAEANSERLLKAIERAEKKGNFDLSEKLTIELEENEREAMTGEERGANVLPLYLNIRNPLIFDMEGKDLHAMMAAITEAKKKGHDGLKLVNVWDPVADREGITETTQWVAFRPEQIKSAIGNRGTFDANSPDIRFSRRQIIGDTGRQRTPEQLAAFRRLGREIEIPTIKERMGSLWQDAGKKLAQGLVDQFRPIRDISREAYALLRLSKGASGAFQVFLQGGRIKLTDKVYDFDETKRGGVVDRLLIPLQGEADDFMWWVAGNRAELLTKEDREHLFTADDIKAMKSLADGETPFVYTLQHGPKAGQTTRKRAEVYRDSLITFNEFHKNALDMAEQSNLIDGASRKFWEKEFYVPFYRISDDDPAGIRGMNIKSSVVRQKAFETLKGGKNKLHSDLLENTLMNWAHLFDAAAKNRAAEATLQAALKIGVARRATYLDKNTVWHMGEIIRKIPAGTTYTEGGVQKVSDGTAVYRTIGKVEYVVDDPFVLTAISSLEYAGLRGPLMDAMGTFKHALTIGVTASPFFKVRNLIRDSIHAVGTSPLSYNVAGNVVRGFKFTNQKSDDYFRLLAGGGTIHFGTMLEGSESRRTRALIKAGVRSETILDDENKLKAFFTRHIEPVIAAYNELGNRGEAINRASLYNQLIKQGVSHAEASLQARDLLDFSMQGAWTGIRFLTQTVPFMNARMQGLYKLGRSASDDPKKLAVVLGATALFSTVLMLAYSDDDDWKKREEWDRDNYWWFKIGGTAFRIPKPFEIGAIASLAERGVELFSSPEMTGERFGKRVYALLSENLSINPVPQLVKPIMDVYANKDSFTGRPIETMGMERLQRDYRFTSRTSMAARAIGTAGHVATGGNFFSPAQVDHLVRAYFGWLGSFVVGAADVMARPVSAVPDRPTPDYWRTITGGMISALTDAPSRYVTQMYDQAKEIEEAYGTWRMMLREGRTEEAREFFEDNRSRLLQYRGVEALKRTLTVLNQRIRLIEQSSIPADEKRQQILAIKQQKDQIARRLN